MTDVATDFPLIPAEPTPTPAPVQLSLVDASQAWVSAPAEPVTEPVEPLRNPDGTFAAATPSDPPPADAGSAPDTPAPPADDPTLFLEAKVGEEVVKLRKDTLIPTTRHGQVEYEPLEKVQRERMLKKDYDAGRQEIKAERQALAAERAELAHRARLFEAEEARIRAAAKDPAEFDRMTEHFRLMQENPQYAQAVEKAQQKDLDDAGRAAAQEAQEQALVGEAIDATNEWLAEIAGRHPGVDLNETRTAFGMALYNRQPGVNFSRESLEAFVAARAKPVTDVLTPLQEQVAALKAANEKVLAELAALRTQKTTDHALTRARAVPTAPLGGAPVAPGPKVLNPNGSRDLQSMTDAWKRG